MIGYVTLGTKDIARAGQFYDALLGEFGATRFIDSDRAIAWQTTPEAPMLSILLPFDTKEATVGNGVMVALNAESSAQVDALHKKALELGGTDEGAPGPRGDAFYVGYFRDLDGNKLNAFFTG